MYSDQETQQSYEYLQKVVSVLEEPICIFGGWAVFLTVNPLYSSRFGRPYLGSRDIDLGFHLDKKATQKDLQESSFAKALHSLEKNGFARHRFGMLKQIDRETGQTLTHEQAKTKQFYEIIQINVDMAVDNIPKSFKKTFGFVPIDEPLLEQVFKNKDNRTELKEFGRKLLLPSPTMLLATKLKAFPNRSKEDKRLKDAYDMAALLLFSPKPEKLKEVTKHLPKNKIKKALTEITEKEIQQAEKQLGLATNEFQSTITSFFKKP